MSKIMMLSIIFGVRQGRLTEYLMTYVRRGYGEEVGGMYHTGNCTTETVSTRGIHPPETMICDWGPSDVSISRFGHVDNEGQHVVLRGLDRRVEVGPLEIIVATAW